MHWTTLSIMAAVGLLASCGEINAAPSAKAKKQVWRRTFQEINLSSVKVDALAEQMAPVLALTKADLEKFITSNATFYDLPCPICSRKNQQSNLGPRAKWNFADPFHVTCAKCNTTFPNDKYKETTSLEITLPNGKKQVYHYWAGPNGEQYFFTDAAREHLVAHLHKAARSMGKLWLATKDPKYARQALRIVARSMQVYPDIPLHGDEGNDCARKKFILAPPYIDGQMGAKWGRGHDIDIVPMELVKTYDTIYDAPVFKELDAEFGCDVRAMIENGFRDGVRLSLVTVAAWDKILRVGICLKDPVLTHRAVRAIFEQLTTIYGADGLDPRGPGYHRHASGYMDVVNSFLKGYSDPPGYRDLDDGTRFDGADLSKVHPVLWRYLRERSATIRARMSFPNGQYVAAHDAWPKRRGLPAKETLKKSTPQLVPAWGYAVLGYGRGDRQVQAHLHYSFLAGHGHADMLNLVIWGTGREWVTEFGYSHGELRAWSASTLAHNTVQVDEKCQDYRRDGHAFGNLLIYEPILPGGVQVVEADGSRGYDRIIADLKSYRRELVLVPAGDGNAYVVDIFRIEGGKKHDWVINGAIAQPDALDVDLPLTQMPGTLAGPDKKVSDVKLWPDEVREGRDSEYGLVDNLRGASVDKAWTASLHGKGQEAPMLKMHMLGGPGRQVIVGRTPNPRRGVTHKKSRLLMVRSAGPSSIFVVVWEPVKAKPFISSVKPVKVAGGDKTGAVGIEVRLADGAMHRIISSPQDADKRFRFEAKGADSNVSFVLAQSRAKGAMEGRVLNTHGPAEDEKEPSLDVSGSLPAGTVLAGRCMIVTHADGTTRSHIIVKVEPLGKDQQRVYVQDDPGYAITWRNVAINEPTLPMLVTRYLYGCPSAPTQPSGGANGAPRRTIEGGSNTYRINAISGR